MALDLSKERYGSKAPSNGTYVSAKEILANVKPESVKKADTSLRKFKVDTDKFLTSVSRDFGYDTDDEEERKQKSFNAAEYFEERKRQADELKSRLGDATKNLEANAEYYTPEYYDSMAEYLSNFDTMVDDVLSNYKPSLESREGMRAYEDEMIAAMERNSRYVDERKPHNGTLLSYNEDTEDFIPDYSYRSVNSNWTPEQRYNLGHLQLQNPEEAQKYATEVNKYLSNMGMYEEQERQKQELEALDLNAAKKEIDALRSELDNFYATHDYTADAEYRQKQKELTQKTTLYNQAKRQQEAEAFRSVTTNDDFAAKSGYVSTEAQNFRDRMFSEYGMGYNDLTYEYINDPERVQAYNDEFTRRMLESNYELMQNEEVAIYNYLYATEGKKTAQAYLDNIQEDLNRRRTEQVYQNLEGKPIQELAYGVNVGVNNWAANVRNSLNTKDQYIPYTTSQLAGQMVSQDLQDRAAIKKAETGRDSIAPLLYDVITTTSNILPSIAAGALANVVLPGSGAYVGSALMGASAAGGAYQEAINSGYSKEQARTYSTMVGVAETGMEAMLGLVGGGMPDAIKKKAIDAVDGAIAKFAIEQGANMISEGFEEGLQEVISPWIENVFLMAEKENADIKDVAYASLLGALSTLPFAAAEGGKTAVTSWASRRAAPATAAAPTAEAKTFQTPVETPSVSTEGKAMKISSKEALDVKDFASMSDDGATIMTNDGEVVDYDDVSFADQKQANQFYAVRSLPGLDTEAANDLLTAIQSADAGQDIDSVVGIRDAYRIGYFNQDVKALKTGDASVLSPELRQAVYDIGVRQNQAEAAVKAAATPVTTKPSKGYKRVALEGNIKLNSNQKAQVEFIDKFSDKVSKTSVHVFESYVKNGKRYYKDSRGKEVLAPNGKYVNGEIWVDLKAGDKGEGLILNTFAHEMYHHIEAQNKDDANKLAGFVSKSLGIKAVDKAVDAQIQKARAAGFGEKYFTDRGMSAEQARNEVYSRAMSDFVADSLETMFTRGDPADAIAQLYKEDRTLFDKIKEFIDKFISQVKEFYSDKTISQEGAAVAQLENFQELQRMFMEAANGAGENYQAALNKPQKAVKTENVAQFSNRYDDTVTEQDQKYLDAINRGDMNTAQRMVEEAARKAGYTRMFYHGAKKGGGFTRFREWSYFTENKQYAERYAQRDNPGSLYTLYGKMEKPFDTRDSETKAIFEDIRNEYGLSELQDTGLPDWTDGYDITDYINENNLDYDGVILDEGGDMVDGKPVSRGLSYVLRNSEQVKSADVITYDDNGNIIPISQRFDPENEDIRYSLRNEKPMTNREILSQLDIAKRKPWERDHLQRYQERRELLSQEKPKLESVNAQIKELSADPKQNKAELTQLKAEARALKRSVDSLSRKIREQEQSEMFKRIVTEERLRLMKETGKNAQKSYKNEQRKMVEAMNLDQRMIREMLTGTKSLMSRMEDKFVDLVKAYENKEIDRKTMRKMFVQLGQEYDQQTKDAKIWDREFSRLMKMYDELSEKYTKDTGDAKKKIKRLEETILRQRATAKARVEGRRNTEMRHKIQKKVNELNKILLHGTKHRNVPEGMQAAVAAVLDSINMETKDIIQRVDTYEATLKRYTERIARATDPAEIDRLIDQRNRYAAKGDQFGNKMSELKAAYEQIQNDNIPELEMDAGIYEHLMTLFVLVGDTPLGKMDTDQMNAVIDVLDITMATIRNANKLLAEERSAGVLENSKDAVREIRSAGETKKTKTRLRKNLEQFGWNNLKPSYVFDVIGSKTLSNLYESLRSGEDTLAVDLDQAKKFFQEQWKKNGGKEWDIDKKYKFESTSGKSFELDLNQIMSLYAMSKDKDARSHLRVGGFAFDSDYQTKEDINIGPVKIPVKVESSDASAYNLSDEILGEIISTLTPQQRAFADAMQAYLSDTMAAKGNEVSIKKYGIRLFKKKDYFPIRVADQFMAKAREQQAGDRKLKDSGFTKERKPEAKNPVVLSAFTEIWAEHVDEMSLYHSFVLPLDDFNRVLNYHDAFVEGQEAVSVVEAITNAFGKGATNYIDQLIKDVNGGARGGSTVSFANSLVSKAKKAQTMASLSVAIQQPSSIIRAMSTVDAKYFIGPKVTEKTTERTWEEIKRYAPIAIIKEMGGYDTNVGKSTVDYLTDTSDYETFGEKFKAIFTDSNYRDEQLGRLPAFMDETSWSVIWNAVKREQRDIHPNMDVKSDAFMKTVANRFTEVITRTQVYDSVFSRSGMMRDKKSDLAKMITSFMAEPTTASNMTAVSLFLAKRGDIKGKQAARTIGANVASLALNAALASIIYAMRDDDEDKRYDEKYLENFRNNFFESLHPATYIPYVRDVYNLFAKGYDVERADMELFGDLQNALKGLSDEDISSWEKTEAVIGSIGNLLGVPVKNILRDVKGIVQTMGFAFDDRKNPRTKTGAYMARRGMDLSDKEQMILAVRKGDEEHLQRVFGRYETQEDSERALQGAIREKYVAGEMDAQEAQELLDTYFDRDDEHDIYWILDEWDYAKEHGNTDGYTKMGALLDAVDSGDYEAEIKRYLDHGSEMSEIQGAITKKYKKQYLAADEAGRESIRNKMMQVYQDTGMYESDILKRFNDWDFEAEYGMTYSDMKAEYREGNVTESDLRNAMTFYGRKKFEIDQDIRDLNEDIKFRAKFDMSLSQMKDAYDNGDVTKRTLENALIYSGMTKKEAQQWITQRDISNQYGIDYMYLDDAYKAGDISRADLYNSMIKNGATKQEADDAILAYDWLKKNYKKYPDLAVGDAKKFAVRLSSDQPDYTLTDFGVKIDDYIEYSKLRPDCKGVDNNGDGKADDGTKRDAIFKMIDSLPISSDAKDGLALIDYGMKSILKNAPWH